MEYHSAASIAAHQPPSLSTSSNPLSNSKGTHQKCGNRTVTISESVESAVQDPLFTSSTYTDASVFSVKISEIWKGKKEITIKCASEIEMAFPLPNLEILHPDQRAGTDKEIIPHFWYTNENNEDDDIEEGEGIYYRSLLDELSVNTAEFSHNPRIGILVGESSLLSSLPELARHCDIILLADYDPILLHSLIRRIELFKKCCQTSDETQFNLEVCELISKLSKPTQDKAPSLQSLLFSIESQKTSLRHYYPFSSEERLAQVKESLDQVTVIPVFCNLFSKAAMLSLSNILKDNGGVVSVMNLSNAMEYEYNFYPVEDFDFEGGPPLPYKWVKALPVKDNALCRFSIFRGDRACRSIFWSRCDFFAALENQERIRNIDAFRPPITAWFERLLRVIESALFKPSELDLRKIQTMLVLVKADELKKINHKIRNLYAIIDNHRHGELQTKTMIKGWINNALDYHFFPQKIGASVSPSGSQTDLTVSSYPD